MNCGICRGGIIQDYENGDLVCGTCGRIYEQRTQVMDITEPGPPIPMTANGLISNKDHIGRKIDSRLTKTQIMLTPGNMVNLERERRILDSMCIKLGIAHVSDQAFYYYKKYKKIQPHASKNNNVLMAACISITCKLNKIVRTGADISKLLMVRKKLMFRYQRQVMQSLDIRAMPFDPEMVLPNIASKVGASTMETRKSCNLIRRLKKDGIHLGRNPICMAAGSLWFAMKKRNIKHKTFAENSGISDAELRKIVKLFHIIGKQAGFNPELVAK